MINRTSTLTTLIRKKINSNDTYEDKEKWFQEKGIMIKKKDNMYLFRNIKNKESELSKVCNYLIFKDNDLICYGGPKVEPYTLKEGLELERFIWNKDTLIFDYINTDPLYLYFNNDWHIGDSKNIICKYEDVILKQIYNIISVAEYDYTYILKYNGKLYLDTIFNNKTCNEESFDKIDSYARRFALRRPILYKFELDKFEENDFPKVAQDISKNKIILTALK